MTIASYLHLSMFSTYKLLLVKNMLSWAFVFSKAPVLVVWLLATCGRSLDRLCMVDL